MEGIGDLHKLARLCLALGAESLGPLAPAEKELVGKSLGNISDGLVSRARLLIESGSDPLGDAYCRIVSPQQRRPLGQTYTPAPIIQSMVAWAADKGSPVRIVDPGAGSGRYMLAAAKKFSEASVIGIDIDPMATLMLRANLVAGNLAHRSSVYLGDYRSFELPVVDGPTLFIGNPPYVRHHQIDPAWKKWLLATARKQGLNASGLAGLHVHFFLATAEHARLGDYGAFITSAEWLDVNYGRLVRELLLEVLGGESVHVLDPTASPFADATTTGAIACF